MNNFQHRKLFLLLFLFIALFSAYVLVPLARPYIFPIGIAACVLCLFLGGVLFQKISPESVIFILLAFVVAFSSVMHACFYTRASESAFDYMNGSAFEVNGKITEVSHRGTYSSSYIIDVIQVGSDDVDFSASLEIEKITFFEYGDIISFTAIFEKTDDETLYLRGKNIFVSAATDDAVFYQKSEKDLKYYIHTANEYMCDRMVDMLGKNAGGFCSALILGNRTYVSSGMRLDFARIGISHLLALSGLHLSILAQTIDFILRGFLKKKYRNIVLIISCFAFAVFTGLSASVIRASIMLAVFFAADIIGEENDSLTSLSIAAFLIILFDPSSVYDIGFWLSVCATLGIVLMRPAMDELFYKWQKPRKNKPLRSIYSVCKYFYGILSMSFAAFLFTLPVCYFAFGEISLIGIFSNFIFIPLATVLLVLCVLFIPFSFVPYLDEVISYLRAELAEFMIDAAHAVSDIKGVNASLNYPFSNAVFISLGVILLLFIFIKKFSLVKIGAVFFSFIFVFFACLGTYSVFTKNDVNLSLSSAKSGEFFSFKADGESYVIDISTGKYSYMYEALMSVKEFACTEVDNLVITHYHLHHQNSIYRLSDKIKIRNVILPYPQNEAEEEIFTDIKKMLENCGIDYTVYTRGGAYICGLVNIDFAPLYKLSRSEKPIVALKISVNDASFSYIESAAFEGTQEYGKYFSADAVFIGSHGPNRKFKSSAEVLSSAQYVIFSASNEEFFRDKEKLSNVWYLEENSEVLKILFDN